MIATFKKLLHKTLGTSQLKPASEAYDEWAKSYDAQPGNLMLDLDEDVFSELLGGVNLVGKQIADIGCGTGRHWSKLYAGNPAFVRGFDVSAGMLGILEQKFPLALTSVLNGITLTGLDDGSLDIIISTLTIAHIKDAGDAFKEWDRVLKPGGEVIITDYHPVALEKGARRTFKSGTKTVAIKNHIHSIPRLISLAKENGWRLIQMKERKIDESVRHYYQKQQALAIYKNFEGVPIIYGLHFKKY